jgi:hypothetical protein
MMLGTTCGAEEAIARLKAGRRNGEVAEQRSKKRIRRGFAIVTLEHWGKGKATQASSAG